MTVIDLEQIVRGEYDENVERMGFQPTEMNAIPKGYQGIMAAAQEAATEGRRRGGLIRQGSLPDLKVRVEATFLGALRRNNLCPCRGRKWQKNAFC